MSLFFRSQQRALGDSPDNLVPARIFGPTRKAVTPDQAMRHSAVWACIRLRAGLISSLPVDVFRMREGMRQPVPTPSVLLKPGALFLGGSPVSLNEWLYATQTDLDRVGNAFGLIVERDATMRPSRIDLVAASSVTVRTKAGVLSYVIDGQEYTPAEVWHERQYVLPGLAVGLSPVGNAALTLGGYFNAQDFAAEWFSGGSAPAGHLKNVTKTLEPHQADTIKARFKSSISNGDVFVSGQDWEYSMLGIDAKQTEFINAQKFSISDAARFFDCPGDLIDAESGASNITYANITQRNLQLLVMHLGPAIQRRETALAELTPRPQVTRLDREALLAMDPVTRAEWVAKQIDARTLTPDEARRIANRAPLTEDDILLFNRLFDRTWRFNSDAFTTPQEEEEL